MIKSNLRNEKHWARMSKVIDKWTKPSENDQSDWSMNDIIYRSRAPGTDHEQEWLKWLINELIRLESDLMTLN